jgi:hypothetical protein
MSTRQLEVGEWGLREASWEDLQLVTAWRTFLENPRTFLHHLLQAEAR